MGELKSKKYSFHYGPWMTLTNARLIAKQAGIPFDIEAINCQLFIHTIYRDLFGVQLPQLWSKEIYEDQLLFVPVKKTEKQYVGDIFMFQPYYKKEFNPMELHLAVATGEFINSKPVLAHATYHVNGVDFWELDRFINSNSNTPPEPRYILKTIKRLRDDLWIPNIRPFVGKKINFDLII